VAKCKPIQVHKNRLTELYPLQCTLFFKQSNHPMLAFEPLQGMVERTTILCQQWHNIYTNQQHSIIFTFDMLKPRQSGFNTSSSELLQCSLTCPNPHFHFNSI